MSHIVSSPPNCRSATKISCIGASRPGADVLGTRVLVYSSIFLSTRTHGHFWSCTRPQTRAQCTQILRVPFYMML